MWPWQDKRILLLLSVVGIFTILGMTWLYYAPILTPFSIFMEPGVTKTGTLDTSGEFGDAKEYVSWSLSANVKELGMAKFKMIAKDTEGYVSKDLSYYTWLRTNPGYCRYSTELDENDVINLFLRSINSDARIYQLKTPQREQTMDVAVSMEENPTFTNMDDLVKKQGLTFSVYAKDLYDLPGGVAHVNVDGTHQGEGLCTQSGSYVQILVDPASGKIIPLDRFALNVYMSGWGTILLGHEVAFPTMPSFWIFSVLDINRLEREWNSHNIIPTAWKDHKLMFDKQLNILKYENKHPGEVQATILMPRELFLTPLTDSPSETEIPGSTPVEVIPDAFYVPKKCQPKIEDITLSADAKDTFWEGTSLTGYVKLSNYNDEVCTVTVSGTGQYATVQDERLTLAPQEKNRLVEMQIDFGSITAGDRGTPLDFGMTFTACHSSLAEGTTCVSRSKDVTLLDRGTGVTSIIEQATEDGSEVSPPPSLTDANKTCLEKANLLPGLDKGSINKDWAKAQCYAEDMSFFIILGVAGLIVAFAVYGGKEVFTRVIRI
jgi:hypothetical protein